MTERAHAFLLTWSASMANAIAINAPIMAYWHRAFTDPDFQCTLLPAMLKDKMRMLLPLYHKANPQRNIILAWCCFAAALSNTPAWPLAIPLVKRIATQVKDLPSLQRHPAIQKGGAGWQFLASWPMTVE